MPIAAAIKAAASKCDASPICTGLRMMELNSNTGNNKKYTRLSTCSQTRRLSAV